MPITDRVNRAIGLFALFGTLAACGDAAPVVVDAAAAAEGSAVAAAVPHDVRQARERLRDEPEAVWAELIDAAVGTPLRYLLLEEGDSTQLRRKAFLAALYAQRDWRPVFVDGAGLTPQAEALLATLDRAAEHALQRETYVRPALADALETLRALAPAWGARPPLALSRDERRALADALEEATVAAADRPDLAALEHLLSRDDEALTELRALHGDRLRLARAVRGQAAIAEALLADAFLAWAFDQRHFNVSMLDDDLTDRERDAVIAERMRTSFEEIVGAASPEAAAAVMDFLQPHHPQYPLLMAERARYAAIVEAGGWERVAPMTLRRGHRHARVAELKQRLAVEGYYDGPIDEVFDAPLEEAVRDYQETHQFEVTGESSQSFWNSLNVPAADRLAQIELTMQRWREARAGDDPYYIHVNIPDFHAEVWRNGERLTRFRIVVGNTQRVCDPSTRTLRYANATPIQTATMSYVVLNPHWNIPSRILEEELLPELVEDETYFAENGIERFTENGITRIRQIPGPSNPLGRVKFMFPNPHDTYMHDTSRPQYFRYPIRAFSHGCMRVENPLDFLELLLRNDGQWDEARIERIFESGVETSIRLNTHIPVHVEYYVVRVDDEGRANFLSDIYRYDRDRLNPPDPSELRCEPDAPAPLRLTLDEELRPVYRDPATGNVYDLDSAEARTLLGEDVAEGEDADDPAAGDFGP
jgi:murein L,D-transpeptidase YcbB/YkuD